MITVTDEDRARVQEVVDEMARSVGLEPPCVRVRNTKGCARVTEQPRGRLDADPKLTRAPLSVLRKMLAHELAHVWCGHATRQRRISTMPFFTAIAIWLATLIWLQLDQPPELVPDIVIVTLALCVLVMGMAGTAPSVHTNGKPIGPL